jgi:aspartyl-tRNA(Asn)/glutamyl-tRNA(Gln) amidotransferase subunit C
MPNANAVGVCTPGLHFEFCILNYDPSVPTTLTVADVERIAALAQLELTDEEKQLFTKQLADILAYAEQVQAIDTSGVEATAYVNAAQRMERDDEPRPCLSVEEAIANAPDAAPEAGLFRVPRVIGG